MAFRLPKRLDPQRRRWNRFWRGRRLRAQIHAPVFSIVSCNCWGSQIYQDLRRPYLTPFVGLYLHPESFLRFCENYERAVLAPLEFVLSPSSSPTTNTPLVGRILGDIDIHFAHYRSEQEAREKWVRRCARLPARPEDCHYMMCDRDACTDDQIARFLALPYRRKIFFAAQPRPKFPEIIVVPPRYVGDVVDDGVELYDQCGSFFDIAQWVNAS